LGDFRILREIGRGGMGIVYEAAQVSLGRRVALKVLPFAATLDAKQLQRFKNEAQAAAHLHHCNIVPVHATGCERGVHYYAMQFIDGQTLVQMIAELRRLTSKPETGSQRSERAGEATADAASGCVVQSRERETITLGAGISTERSIRSRAHFQMVARLGVQCRRPRHWSMPTSWASSTATSSRPTCWSTCAAIYGSPTSGWLTARVRPH
jgi:hypothetical protein